MGGTERTTAGRALVQRVCLVGQTGLALNRRFAGLIGALLEAKHGVICLHPSDEDTSGEVLRVSGSTYRTLPAPSRGFQLFPARARIATTATTLAEIAPHAVLLSGGDELAILAAAARRARVSRIVVLIDDDAMRQGRGIKRVLEIADAAIFLNSDQRKELDARGDLPGDLAHIVIPAPGVDLATGASPLPPFGSGLTFLSAADDVPPAHVRSFFDAARQIRARTANARFVLARGRTGATGDLTIDVHHDVVEIVTVDGDLRDALAHCHVFVYPSPGEGMPISVLQALAVGRPIITTETPGCRETVDDKVNGCLVAPGDPAALAAAMETFLRRPDLIPHLARASRAKAERRFDLREVSGAMMKVLGVA